MANELQLAHGATGRTIYAVVRNHTSGFLWSTVGPAFEVFTSGNWANYAISLVEQGVTGYYVGNMPSAIPAGVYGVEAREQLGGSPTQLDARVAAGDVHWTGTIVPPLSDTATSGQLGQLGPLRMARGTMVKPFLIDLVSATDHLTPFTSGVVSGQISRDGAAFTALQSGEFTEVGLGTYKLQALTSGDLLCNAAMLVFTANGISGGVSDPRRIPLVLQRSSGQ